MAERRAVASAVPLRVTSGRMPGDLLRVVEAAYAPAPSEKAWLEGIAAAALPCLDRGLGLCVYIYDASNLTDFRISTCVGAGATPVGHAEIESVVRAGSPETTRKYYEPGPPTTMSSFFPAIRRDSPSDLPALVENVGRHGIADVLGVRGGDPSRRGCIITVGSPTKLRLAPALRRTLAQLGAHLAAAWRIQGPNRPEGAADAVLDTEGRVLDAQTPDAVSERR